MKRIPFRLRLGIWYTAAFACALIVASLASYWAVRRHFDEVIDEGLHNRVEGARRFIEEQLPYLSLDQIGTEFRDHVVVALGPGSGLIQLCDTDGAFIYQSTAFRRAGLPPPEPDTLSAVPVLERRTLNGQPVRMVTARIDAQGRRFGVQAATITTANDLSLQRLRIFLMGFCPLLLAIASAGGHWIAARALRPVAMITSAVRAIDKRNLSQRLDVPAARDELRDLSETLNTMLDRIEASFRQLSRFTADASHELRTPVTSIRTSAEVALRRDRTADEYRRSLIEIQGEAVRMSMLVDNLLALARADRGADRLALSPVDLRALLQELAESAAQLAQSRQLEFEARLAAHPVVVEGDATALRQLVLIASDNALKYTPAPGRVEWSLTTSDGTAAFEVTDTGIGIDPSDLPHVFERFYRADRARTRDSGGAGLGLEIAKWIVDRHGGSIAITSEGHGCRLRVTLPTKHGATPTATT